jgi:hypothetical protein
MVEKNKAPTNADDIYDAISDPIAALGELAATSAGKKECDKNFAASSFKKGCACCSISLMGWTMLQGGADSFQQWKVLGVQLRNTPCTKYLDETEKIVKARQEKNRKLGIIEPPPLTRQPEGGQKDIELKVIHIDY